MHPPALYYYYNSARHNMCIRAALNQPASCTLHNAQCTMHRNTPISMHNIHVQTINNCPCWQQRTNSKRLPVAPVTCHGPWADLPLCVCVFFCVFVCLFFSSFLPFFLSLSSLFSLISRFLSFSLSFFLSLFLSLSFKFSLGTPRFLRSLDLPASALRETWDNEALLPSSIFVHAVCKDDEEPCLKAARSHAISAEPSLNSLHCRPCLFNSISYISIETSCLSRTIWTDFFGGLGGINWRRLVALLLPSPPAVHRKWRTAPLLVFASLPSPQGPASRYI